MIALDEDALICDFAETYNIYDYEHIPVTLAATLAAGLRDDARIKMKASGIEVDAKTLLLAHIADNTAINVYFKTEDAKKRRNKPPSLLKLMTHTTEQKQTRGFKSGDDFLAEWRRLNGN